MARQAGGWVGSRGTHPLQVLPQVCEEFQAAVEDILLLLCQVVHLVGLGGQQRLVGIGFPLQLPVLVDEVNQSLGQVQALGHLSRLHQLVEVFLQLLQPLLAQGHLLQVLGSWAGLHRLRRGLTPRAAITVLLAE